MASNNSLTYLKKQIESSNFEMICKSISRLNNPTDLINLINQKIYRKIYFTKDFSDIQKQHIKNIIINNFPKYAEEVQRYFLFVEWFSDISTKIYSEIEMLISSKFKSLLVFSCCLDSYVYEEKEDILFVRNFLFNIAVKVLNNDFYQFGAANITLPINDLYRKNRPTILRIINLAIEYGAISEQYDDVSYGIRKVSAIKKESTVFAKLVLTNEKKEFTNWFGLQYENYLYNSKKEPLLPEVYDYYKCLICKAGNIRGIPPADIENAKLILEWTYLQLKPFDYIFFLCNAYPSYILSIMTYIYTKLICMYFFDKESYQIIKLTEIRQNMLFNNYISDAEFNECINLMSINDLRNKDMAMKSFHPFMILDENRIIICKWMLSTNFNLISDVKDICFNSSISSKLGLIANHFGKSIFEKLVKSRFETKSWNVLNKNIVIKSKKQPLTDIDLIAYKNNLLLLGQLKVAHSGYGLYQKWKAERSIISGISQCGIASRYFEQNKDYLVSLLKNHKIINSSSEIKQIISVVITSSNFFAEMPNTEDVSVIGVEMLDELLYYAEAQPDLDYRKLTSMIKHPISKYKFEGEPEFVYSKIVTDNFELLYQELE